MTHGLVIGKFYPPHLGHSHLISAAAAQVDRLTVLVMAARNEKLSLAKRVGWLREIHDGEPVDVIGAPCDVPMDLSCEAVWRAHVAIMRAAVRAHTEAPVDVVFSSETYGPDLADYLDAGHCSVDLSRSTYPVSGTAVRADLPGSWRMLHPVVRAGLTTRVVLLGSESTGTTTVSHVLAEQLRRRGGCWADTRWVPEHGRDYTVAKLEAALADARRAGRPRPGLDDLVWCAEDFASIAKEQDGLESAALHDGSPALVCDTDALTTRVWERRYVDPRSRAAAAAVPEVPSRSIYLVTDHVGVPFVQDGWRDGEHVRAAMTGWIIEELIAAEQSWTLLTGPLPSRVDLATRIVDGLTAF